MQRRVSIPQQLTVARTDSSPARSQLAHRSRDSRVITELPVRLLYVVIQVTFELLDRLLSDPRECLGTVVVARKTGPGA